MYPYWIDQVETRYSIDLIPWHYNQYYLPVDSSSTSGTLLRDGGIGRSDTDVINYMMQAS